MEKYLIDYKEVPYAEFEFQLKKMIHSEIKERNYYNSYLENVVDEEPMSECQYFKEQLSNAYDELENNDEILVLNTIFSITK